MEQNQFKVIYTGNLQEGFDSAKVSQAFADRFKIPLAKATKIIQAGQEVTIKARAEHVKAYKFKSLLESLGMVVRLERAAVVAPKPKTEPKSEAKTEAEQGQHPPAQNTSGAWTLEPVANKESDEQEASNEPESPAFNDLSRPTKVLEPVKKQEPEPEEPATVSAKTKRAAVSDDANAWVSTLKTVGGWVFAGLGVLYILVKKVGIFKILKLGGVMTAAAFAGYQPDEVCMGNDRCEEAVEEQIDDCWEQSGLEAYDMDYMSEEEYNAFKPTIEEKFIACFVYEDTFDRVFVSPIDLRFDLMDNCLFSEADNCEQLAESQFKACYDRHQIAYLVSASTTDFYQEVNDHADVFKEYYGCFQDDAGQPLFAEVLAGWDELY